MKVNGSAVLAGDRQRVYQALNDPAVLAGAIPGCESLVALGEDRYRMTVTAGVASIKGTYDGEVALSEQRAPESFTLRARGAGAPGTVDATCRVTLIEQDGGTTRLEYAADAVVGGVVGGVGQRMLTGVAKKMAGQFFGNVDDVLTGRAPTMAPVAPQPATPVATGGGERVPAWLVLAGVAAGAGWALAGVLVGWRLARGRAGRS